MKVDWMPSKALVALVAALALSRPAWCQTATEPFTLSNGHPYEQQLRKPMAAPQPDESEDDEGSYAVRPGADRAQDSRLRAAPDRSLNPYLATPTDLYGAAGGSDERSAADLYGLSGTLDSLGGAPAYGLKPATGLTAGPRPLVNLHAGPAASGLKDVTIERNEGGLEPASAGRDDAGSPQPSVYGSSPTKPRTGMPSGDASGLFGFNPYDAKSIVAPTGAPAPGAPGATSQSFGAAGFTSELSPSPSLIGLGASVKSSSSGSLNSPLPASLPSTLPSSLAPAPLGPLR